MINTIRHENDWPWGTDITFIFSDGKGSIGIGKEHGFSYGYIHDLIVYPTEREQGRGNYLLNLAESEIKQTGYPGAVLRVVPGTWMEQWYKRHGYEDYNDGLLRDGYKDLIKLFNGANM